MGRPILSIGDTIPWAGFPEGIKRRELKTGIPLSLSLSSLDLDTMY